MEIVDLGGKWTLLQKKRNIVTEASVPGCVHTDLLAQNLIPDPYYRANENELLWIGDVDWLYKRSVTINRSLLQMDKVMLVCEGLDTIAEIAVNGKLIGSTQNAFVKWEFDAKGFLKAGENEISVLFKSTFPYGQEKCKNRTVFSQNEIRQYVRKSQCNYGWDWGPKCITAGIWRPIKVVAFNEARIDDLFIRQEHGNGVVSLNIQGEVSRVSLSQLKCKVKTSLNGEGIEEQTVDLKDNFFSCSVQINNPKLWWPNGMGSQPLYTVEAVLFSDRDPVLSTISRKVGLRTVKLDRHKDEWGESFQFLVNGVPFFAKGANWIPADTFVTTITPDHYKYLLQSAVDANYNMIRVWGGGIYEEDHFYELCDQSGITVWQDFMYACSYYPSYDTEFMENVRVETIGNVKRLRNHACMALWCGNNEIEQMTQWHTMDGDQEKGHLTWEEYGALFDKLIPRIVKEYDPDGNYWPSSPHSPCGDRADFGNPECGDEHVWSVWHGRQPFEFYRTSQHRFISEFGFQSFPEPKMARTFTDPEDRNVTSFVMEHHQRSHIGNEAIVHYMLSWFQLPYGFNMTCWLSQILQGVGVKYAVEHYRRNRPRCMGTLYWQINDCWPVASWSSIDSDGNWKALHYMARRFFAPVLISVLENQEKSSMELHIASDLLQDKTGLVTWTVTDAKGTAVDNGQFSANVKANSNNVVKTIDLSDHIKKLGKRDLLFAVELEMDDKKVSDNFATFERPKHLQIVDPQIAYKIKGSGVKFTIEIESKSSAFWVWVEVDGQRVRLSDNFFHLIQNKTCSVQLELEKPLSVEELEKKINVHSLYSTYEHSV